ncbi:hypothetical protein D9M71_495290 [compost metagenome]
MAEMDGPMNQVLNHKPELHTFEDLYKGETRLNVNAHGAAFTANGHASVNVVNGAPVYADDLIKILGKANIDLKKYKYVRLLVCRSADGGSTSFAGNLKRLLGPGVDIKAFKGPVTMNFNATVMENIFAHNIKNYGLRNGHLVVNKLLNKRVVNVMKRNPFKNKKLFGRFEMAHYSPDHFS